MVEELTLFVAEAKHRDAGRSIARISTNNMQRLGLVSGDIIEIKGKSIFPAIVWPGYPEDNNKKIIRVDGIIRSNIHAGINEKVKVYKVEAKKAQKIKIKPTQLIKVRDTYYFHKILEGRPLIKGQNFRIETLEQPFTFQVTDTQPSGTVLVTRETQIVLEKLPEEYVPGVSAVTYEDIGGLKREIGLIREIIELPLRQPQVYEKLGIIPPKGILLTGPPGCGKTLIARAVANEVDANFISISGPEVFAKYYGESEQRLREIFEEAKANTPCIIFIDEIDSLAPKRSEMTGEKAVERRVVSQMLSLMDGLKDRGEVIVIAATNEPNILDEALRRGGRFDREIEIGVPDRNGRYEILQIHTRGMPLANNVKLEEIADRTHGFVGADVASLCKESAMHSLRRVSEKYGYHFSSTEKSIEIPPEVIDNLEVKMEDFEEALKNIEPSAMREVFIEIPKVTWQDVGGLEDVKQELVETVVWPLKFPKLFEQSKVRPAKGILLNGPPGVGKTLVAKALANESEVNFISIKGPELISKFVGESERGIRQAFKRAKQASPCILFLDELDAIAPRRGTEFGTKVIERVVSQLLTEMDGIEKLKDVLVLGATNREDLIDPALLRPGRFDRVISISTPDKKTRLEIFNIHTREMPLAKEVDLKKLADETDKFSGADIEAVCRQAGMIATREFVKNKTEKKVEDEASKFKILDKHFKKAYEEILKKKKELDNNLE